MRLDGDLPYSAKTLLHDRVWKISPVCNMIKSFGGSSSQSDTGVAACESIVINPHGGYCSSSNVGMSGGYEVVCVWDG